MIIHYIFNLIILILFKIAVIQALEVVYYRDFTPGVTCSSLFSAAQYWTIVSDTYSTSKKCQYSCSRSDNGNTAYILAPDMSDYPNGLQMTKSITQPYSFIGVDLVYLRKIDSLTMSIYDGSTKVFQQDYTGASVGTLIEYNYSLDCSSWSGNMQVTKEVAQINNRISSTNLNVKFKQSVSSSWAWYGILKLRVWANCAENCDVCGDNTNCNKCLIGFKRYSLPSGQKVCEQTHNCNISNCFSCIKSSPSSSSATCVKCMPGFNLNSSNQCIANSGSCTTGKYQSGVSGCLSYSQNCYMQQQNTGITWLGCSSAVNKANYYCVNTEEILIYEHRNYQLFTCGCRIQYCLQCPTASSCQKCMDGYTFNSSTQKCEFQSCPLLYTQDPYTGECLKNCSGANCLECDASQCKVCSTAGNYYIVSANPQDCALCSIPYCSQCSGEGLCQKCVNMYSLNSDRSSCLPCNVSECDQCLSGFSDICQTCSLGYILSLDQKTCNCAVLNCAVCNSENGGICDSCVTGYLISSDQSTCSCDAKHCAVCNASIGSKCDTCVTGYIQNPITTKCSCAVSNCNICNENDGTLCDSCNQDFLPVNAQTSTCSCQVKGCATCLPSNGKVCQTCEPGYSQSGNTIDCQCGVQNCQDCNQSNGSICDTCIYNYLQNTSKTLCSCQVDHCSQCHPANGKICISPFPGYTFDQLLGNCVCSFANCKRCDDNDGTICLECQDGYVRDSNQKCVCAVKNCNICNTSNGALCDSCINNYAPINTQSSTCKCQIFGCQKCQDFDGIVCEICQPNFILDNGKCKCNVVNCSQCSLTDGNICDTCITNYSDNGLKTQCNCQVNSCNQCDANDGKICISPKQGYVYDPLTQKNKCTFSNCKDCDTNDGTICITCQDGYIRDSNQNCVCAVKNCNSCNPTNGILCDSCVTNYIPINAQTPVCQCQVYGCQKCTDLDGLVCQACYPNFILENGKCKCNVTNCSLCNSVDGNLCDKCTNNYLINGINTSCNCQVNSCDQCDINDGMICIKPKPGYIYDPSTQKNNCTFKNCKQCNVNDGTICEVCEDGYTKDPTECKCPISNCSQCNKSNGLVCDTCVQGYQLSSNKDKCTCGVTNCINCNQSNGLICDSCVNGYVTNQCLCNVQNCQLCDSTDGSICKTCELNYQINSQKNQCQCNIENCQTCDPKDGNICKVCINEYSKYQDGLSIKCKLNCNVPNCKDCEVPPYNQTQCKICADGYELNLISKQCVSTKCDVRMCKKCKKYETKYCEVCGDSYILDTNFQCFLQERNDFLVYPEVIENVGYNVTLRFEKQIVLVDNNLSDLFSVDILNYNKPFQTIFISNESHMINFQLVLKENCKDKFLFVNMHDPNFVQINNLQNSQQKEVKLKEYVKKSEEQKQQTQAAKTAASAAANTLTSAMFLVVILTNSYILFSTIDLTTFIYFLLFINVRYPDNMLAFCEIFKNFQFPFIPNIFQQFFTDPGYIQPYTPQKFLDNGADAYFLNGAGQSFTIIIGIMTIYGVLKLLTIIPIPSIKVYVVSKIQSGWEFCGFLDLIGCCYMYVLVSALLQFFCFDFTESLAFISYTLFSLCFIAIFFIPAMMAIFIANCKDLSDPKIQQQYASLIGGFVIPPNIQRQPENQNLSPSNSKIIPQESNFDHQNIVQQPQLTKQQRLMYRWSRYTNVLLYLRKLIYAIILIFLYDHVYLQMILISLLNIFLAYFYLYIRPQQGKYDNIRNGISEIFLIIIQITVCLLVNDSEDQDEQERYNIGWVIIACSSTILAMHIFNVINDLLKATFNLIKDFIITLFKPKKELEKIKKEKLGEIEYSENKLFAVASQISIDKIRSMNRKLSTIIQQGADSPVRQSQALRKLQMHSLLIRSVAAFTKNLSQDNHLNQVQKVEIMNNDIKENEKRFSQCSSPTSKISVNSHRNIEQSALLNPNSYSNQTLNQLQTSRQINSVPQSLNISNNDLIGCKNPSQSQFL